jgi:guanylate kinase
MDKIVQLIADYRPSQSTIELVKHTKIVLLAGISGAGKDTIKNEVIKKQNNFCDIISYTTRKPRINGDVHERQGADYYFIDKLVALEMLQKQQFVEAKLVHGDVIYGTSAFELQRVNDMGKIAITDIDVQGVDEYENISDSVVAFFIVPPSYNVWRQRLRKRYATTDEFETEWPKRRDSAIKELRLALEKSYYHFIVNDNLDNSVYCVNEIANTGGSNADNNARLVARKILQEIEQL